MPSPPHIGRPDGPQRPWLWRRWACLSDLALKLIGASIDDQGEDREEFKGDRRTLGCRVALLHRSHDGRVPPLPPSSATPSLFASLASR